MNYELRIKNLIIFLVILGLVLPSFAFTQQQPITPPATLEEAKEMGEKTFREAIEILPGIIKKIWRGEVLPAWQRMGDWFMVNIWPKIEGWFKKEVESRAKEEIEKRKPIIKEEFEREKEELKEEAPKVGKSLWEKLKELIK